MKLTIEELEPAKDILSKEIKKISAIKPAFYADARIELFEGKAIGALNGNVKGATEDYGLDLGVKVYTKNNGIISAGHMGKSIGESQLNNLKKILNEMLQTAMKRSQANLKNKQKFVKKFPKYTKTVGTKLAEIEINNETLSEKFKKNPRNFSLEQLTKRIENHSKELQKMQGIASNVVSFNTGLERKIFTSSEGTIIDSTKASTLVWYYVVAKGKVIETYHDSLGANYGLEVLDGENPHERSLEEHGKYLAKGTIELSNAPIAKFEKHATVISDPHYNALVTHEVIGHPSEADRALKRETAWAGRAWWFKSSLENEIGKQVGSELLTVISDPTIKGYGNFKYDDEGTPTKKIYNIKNGILTDFLNSRETASILEKSPNGAMRANSASNVPIIRMTNTFIDKGNWKKQEIFEDTISGYYAVGEKIPSAGETRQNFKITCWKLFEIKKGEIGQLFRGGGLTADTNTFLKSIDAVGNDLKIYNIPNCGKGTPMQSMKVSNGGPHIRAKATITGEKK